MYFGSPKRMIKSEIQVQIRIIKIVYSRMFRADTSGSRKVAVFNCRAIQNLIRGVAYPLSNRGPWWKRFWPQGWSSNPSGPIQSHNSSRHMKREKRQHRPRDNTPISILYTITKTKSVGSTGIRTPALRSETFSPWTSVRLRI